MSIIVIDTETTGLLKPEGTELIYQPYIIEVCAIRINNSFQRVGELITLVKPPIPISKKITSITHITDDMVKKSPSSPKLYRPLVDLFLGCHTLVAHNATFDVGMLKLELSRIEKQFNFPWPPIHYCTVEQSLHLKGHRLKLSELYELATGETEIKDAHRAEADVIALVESYRWLKCSST